jgi:predicted RNA-binding protein
MCELKVIIKNRVEFENAIYAKTIETKVVVKDVLGKTMEFKDYKITEVDISKEQLILSSIKKELEAQRTNK